MLSPRLLRLFVIPVFLVPSVNAALVASYNFTSDLTSGDSNGSSAASSIQSGGGLGTINETWGRSSGQTDLYVRGNATDGAATDYFFFTLAINAGTTFD